MSYGKSYTLRNPSLFTEDVYYLRDDIRKSIAELHRENEGRTYTIEEIIEYRDEKYFEKWDEILIYIDEEFQRYDEDWIDDYFKTLYNKSVIGKKFYSKDEAFEVIYDSFNQKFEFTEDEVGEIKFEELPRITQQHNLMSLINILPHSYFKEV